MLRQASSATYVHILCFRSHLLVIIVYSYACKMWTFFSQYVVWSVLWWTSHEPRDAPLFQLLQIGRLLSSYPVKEKLLLHKSILSGVEFKYGSIYPPFFFFLLNYASLQTYHCSILSCARPAIAPLCCSSLGKR